MKEQRFQELLNLYQSGHALPRPFYRDAELYEVELDKIWRHGWLFAGFACQIPAAGDYFVYEVDTDSIIIVRREDGSLAAMHNVCRHRGSLVAIEPIGHAQRLICPYHQWTYDLSGKLATSRGMPADLDQAELCLKPVYLREMAGLIYINLAAEPIDFEVAHACMAPLARPQGFDRARVAHLVDYEVHANWKIVWENNRECYHCDVNHPQYIKANFDRYDAGHVNARITQQIEAATERSRLRWEAQGLMVTHREVGLATFPDADRNIWYSAHRTALVDGYVSESIDGWQVAPLMGNYTDPDVGTLRLRTLPNFWNHSSCDHAVATRLTPAGPRLTKVRVMWLVDQNAVDGRDYHLNELLPFWQLTSEQDWAICERVQRGVDSRAYLAGPLSTTKEYNVDHFIRWYLRQISEDPSASSQASDSWKTADKHLIAL